MKAAKLLVLLLPEVAKAWGMATVPVVAGSGDNAAGAVGVGMVDALIRQCYRWGRRGSILLSAKGFLSKPESAVHSFCHALPQRWHLMSVMLSAASCLDWVAKINRPVQCPSFNRCSSDRLMKVPSRIWFLPYLSVERTPHNNPQAKGVFFGLTHQHGPAMNWREQCWKAWVMRWQMAWMSCMPAALNRKVLR
ncbi:hypothetical protein MJ391_27095 [Escherichia coli]|nr:hypothetical protein MJ391_27095 [Escherichia coli]